MTNWNAEVKMIRSVLNISKEQLDQLDNQKLFHNELTHPADLVEILSHYSVFA